MMTTISSANVFVSTVTCPDATHPTNENPILTDVSKITIQLKPMTSSAIDEGKEAINKLIDSLQSAFEKGQNLYEEKNLKKFIDGGLGLGYLITGIIKFIPEPDNPIAKNLEILDTGIKQLEDEMKNGFDEMKSFISEVKFFVNIISPTSVMMNYLRDCLKHPGPDAVKNFKKCYKENPTLNLVNMLISYLEQKSTNPIRLAMETNKGSSTKKLQKWDGIIQRVLAQFIILEAFATGLLAVESQYKIDVLKKEAHKLLNTIEELRKEYLEQPWDDMISFLCHYIPDHTHLNNAQKADEIAAKLETLNTDDAYYVCVFNQSAEDRDYSYHCANHETQLVDLWNRGKCNTIVYRSRKSYEMPYIEYANSEREVIACKTGKLHDMNTYENVIKEQLLDTGSVRGDGFVFLVSADQNPQIRSAKCPGHQWGPGWWETVTDNHKRDMKLLVGFP